MRILNTACVHTVTDTNHCIFLWRRHSLELRPASRPRTYYRRPHVSVASHRDVHRSGCVDTAAVRKPSTQRWHIAWPWDLQHVRTVHAPPCYRRPAARRSDTELSGVVLCPHPRGACGGCTPFLVSAVRHAVGIRLRAHRPRQHAAHWILSTSSVKSRVPFGGMPHAGKPPAP